MDYLLYLNERIVGVIVAKPSGTKLSEVEWQSRRYAQGLTKEQKLGAVLIRDELQFIFKASGTETPTATSLTQSQDHDTSSTSLHMRLCHIPSVTPKRIPYADELGNLQLT